MNIKRAADIKRFFENKAAEEILRGVPEIFGAGSVALASSLGAEDQVITDMLVKSGVGIGIFTIDTGRLHPETLALLDETQKHYGIKIEALRPDETAVAEMIKLYGADLFYESVEKRKLCCRIRKIEPLRTKLKNLEAWLCGLRKEQSSSRTSVGKVEWDENFDLYKINPLADWTEADVRDYIKKNNVPYNKLHDRGYPSVGCAPCTRAVKPGEDIRAGRWWWESADSADFAKECGLHAKPPARSDGNNSGPTEKTNG